MMKIIECDKEAWDIFARQSAQYTAFSESLFLESSVRPIQYWVCQENTKILGALACEVANGQVANMNHNPYGGIHFIDCSKEPLSRAQEIIFNVSRCFADYLSEHFKQISISHHWSVQDFRAFEDYQIFPRYTSLLDISNPTDTDGYARKRIRELSKGADEGYKFLTKEINDIGLLNRLHELNFIRQGLQRPLDEGTVLMRTTERMMQAGYGKLIATYVNDIPAVVSFFVFDRQRAYHLFVGTDLDYRELGVGTKNFHESCVFLNRELGLKELDLVGANSPLRSSYKLSYGGRLISYFGIRKTL